MNERAYDPEFLPYLDELPVVSDFSTLQAVREVREAREKWFPIDPVGRDDVSTTDIAISGPEGAPEIPLRIYRPIADSPIARPALLEIHGGGFMIGSLDMVDAMCQAVVVSAGAVVVSVDYRLAPESPYPAGVDDCFASLVWLAENASDLGVDPSRIAIAGQSAGGGLAAATTLMARDRGGPDICFQLLEIPELDDRLTTESMVEYTDTPIWNRPNATWSWQHYLDGVDPGEVPAYAAPARAADLSGLPPAYITAMQFDPLRDEGIEYARRLMQAGVPTELHAYPGTFHGSGLIPDAEVSRRGASDSMAAIKRALEG